MRDSRAAAYSSARDRLWLGKGVLTGIIGKKEEAFAGEYLTEGQKTPIKLRSATTLRAISSFEARVDTKNNPVWYSFGTVVLALRYLLASKEWVEAVFATLFFFSFWLTTTQWRSFSLTHKSLPTPGLGSKSHRHNLSIFSLSLFVQVIF